MQQDRRQIGRRFWMRHAGSSYSLGGVAEDEKVKLNARYYITYIYITQNFAPFMTSLLTS